MRDAMSAGSGWFQFRMPSWSREAYREIHIEDRRFGDAVGTWDRFFEHPTVGLQDAKELVDPQWWLALSLLGSGETRRAVEVLRPIALAETYFKGSNRKRVAMCFWTVLADKHFEPPFDESLRRLNVEILSDTRGCKQRTAKTRAATTYREAVGPLCDVFGLTLN